jgi:DNA-binding transcriptional regulator YiaG
MAELYSHLLYESSLGVDRRKYILKSFGEWTPARIRAIRKATGLSRPKFSEKYQLNFRSVMSWELGERRPSTSAQSLLKLIEAKVMRLRRSSSESNN